MPDVANLLEAGRKVVVGLSIMSVEETLEEAEKVCIDHGMWALATKLLNMRIELVKESDKLYSEAKEQEEKYRESLMKA